MSHEFSESTSHEGSWVNTVIHSKATTRRRHGPNLQVTAGATVKPSINAMIAYLTGACTDISPAFSKDRVTFTVSPGFSACLSPRSMM
jgi:hypothetical protein